MYSFVWFELWIFPSYFFFGKIKNFDCWTLDKSATFIIVTSKNMFFCMQIMLSNFKMRVFISCTPYPVPVLKKVKTRQIFGQFTVTAPLSVHAALKEKKTNLQRHTFPFWWINNINRCMSLFNSHKSIKWK